MRERIEARLAATGLNPSSASIKAGKSRDFVRNILRGASEDPRSEGFQRLAEVLGTTAEWLRGDDPVANPPPPRPKPNVRPAHVEVPMPGDMPRNLPVYGTAAGGIIGRGAFQLTPDVVDYVRRPPPLMSVSDAYALYVENDSMVPLHKQGDLLLIHPHRPPSFGDSVVIQELTEAGEVQAFVKILVKRTAEHIITQQLNPAAEVRFPRERVRAIHKVMTNNDLYG